MSYNDFDYDATLDSIKANLFDIYESQEKIIGSIENDESRQQQINKYIKVKDIATSLIDNIEDLYSKRKNKIEENTNNNNENVVEEIKPKLVEINNIPKIENPIQEIQTNPQYEGNQSEIDQNSKENKSNIEENINKNHSITDEQVETNNEVVTENLTDLEMNPSIEQETQDVSETNIEKQPIDDINNNEENIDSDTNVSTDQESLDNQDDIKNDNQIKFYLDDRNGSKPNFAYVSIGLLEVIKKNGTTVIEFTKKVLIDDKKIQKSDEEKPKGIIVRNDQFMKLALSRHRQEGVLEDARSFRIEQAKASRKKLIQDEKEKMKTKTLKIV